LVAAVHVNSTMLLCTAPARAAATVPVSVTVDDGQSFTNTASFIYHATPTVTSISPSLGIPNMRTWITVTGTNFAASPGLVCRFGTAIITRGGYISPSSIRCLTPLYTDTTVGAINVSLSC